MASVIASMAVARRAGLVQQVRRQLAVARVGVGRRGGRRGAGGRGEDDGNGHGGDRYAAHQIAVQPPSTASTVPVTKLLASDAR